jgi:hypothetical protein
MTLGSWHLEYARTRSYPGPDTEPSMTMDELCDLASFDVSPCCGVTAGYEDCQPSAARSFRERWLSSGAAWWQPSERPAGWRLDEQLAHVPEKYR